MLPAMLMREAGNYHQTAEQVDAEMAQVKAAQANPRDFEPLYTRYYKRIVDFIYHRVDDKELAFEITAQVFYIALEKISQFKAQGVPFGAWLFRIASNELNLWFRKKKAQRIVIFGENGLEELKDSVEETSSALMDQQLFAALEQLDHEEMELIDMRFFEKRSFKEISEISGLGESACKMRIYRILEKLKTNLQNS